MYRVGMEGLAPKWVRLAPNGTNPGLFRSDFSAFEIGPKWDKSRGFFRSDFSAFGALAPNALKSDLKSPEFVPFGANLTHFGAKPTIPGIR